MIVPMSGKEQGVAQDLHFRRPRRTLSGRGEQSRRGSASLGQCQQLVGK